MTKTSPATGASPFTAVYTIEVRPLVAAARVPVLMPGIKAQCGDVPPGWLLPQSAMLLSMADSWRSTAIGWMLSNEVSWAFASSGPLRLKSTM